MKPDNSQTSNASIDFSPLNRPVTDAEYAEYRAFSKKTSTGEKVSLAIIIAVVIVASLFVFPWQLVDALHLAGLGVLAAIVIWLGFVGGVIYAISLAIRAYDKKLARFYTFAARNNLTFIMNRTDPGYAGMIFNEGHSRVISQAFDFPHRAEIGSYNYTVGSGKNSTTYVWTYIKTKLPRKLPNMVLDSKENNNFGLFSNLPDAFKKDQKLSLEGDFDQHFTLYAPKEYKRDALYVFTPDVMAALIDNGGGYDMEVVDDELFIYKSGPYNFATESELTKLLSIVDSIASELREQADYYADERVGDRMQNVIAPQGSRLKHRMNWVAVIAVAAIILYTVVPMLIGFFVGNSSV